MSAPEKSYHTLRRHRLLASGLCIDCAKAPHTETAKRCKPCSDKVRVRGAKHWRKLKSERNESGTRYAHAPEDGATFGEIADDLGLSRQATQRIFYSALAKVTRECKRRGIDASMIVGRGFSMIAMCEKWAKE